MSAVIVWLRRDLRQIDNPALHAAAASGRPVVPVFIVEPDGAWSPGAASRYWLHHSLAALNERLAAMGSRLIVARGDPLTVLQALVSDLDAAAVYWNRRYEPAAMDVDKRCKAALSAHCEVRSFNGLLLHEPHTVATKSDKPYRVFTPFYRACLQRSDAPDPLPAPASLPAPARWPPSLALSELGLLPSIDWAAGIRERWTFGEAGAWERLEAFIGAALGGYTAARDRPAAGGVSMLSPHLAFGEISVRSLRHALATCPPDDAAPFIRQLYWREFAYHVLYHFPATTDAPMREQFTAMHWVDDRSGLRCWQQGLTGYPLVDAGMRELWHTGYMHNRVRMVVASFLCKHLGIHWLDGARWFWDTLVDADLANNTMGWQWVAGSGADAAPYFRIFNPLTQGSKFDADGAYIRRWVAELRDVPGSKLHLAGAGGYCTPIVEHRAAREAALARYAEIRQ